MPDLGPSVALLKKLGLYPPTVRGKVPTEEEQEGYDIIARQKTLSDPSLNQPWKRFASEGLSSLVNIPRGLLGLEAPSEEESPAGRWANQITQIADAAHPGGVAGLLGAGLPFLRLSKGRSIFHGTPKVFKEFDTALNDTSDLIGDMIHASKHPNYSEGYAVGGTKHSGSSKGRANTVAMHPQAKNVLDLVNPNPDDLSQALASLSKEDRAKAIQNFRNDKNDPDRLKSLARHITGRIDTKKLATGPFDAVKYYDGSHEAYAIPEGTDITTPWGTPLTKPQKNKITVIRDDSRTSGGVSTVAPSRKKVEQLDPKGENQFKPYSASIKPGKKLKDIQTSSPSVQTGPTGDEIGKSYWITPKGGNEFKVDIKTKFDLDELYHHIDTGSKVEPIGTSSLKSNTPSVNKYAKGMSPKEQIKYKPGIQEQVDKVAEAKLIKQNALQDHLNQKYPEGSQGAKFDASFNKHMDEMYPDSISEGSQMYGPTRPTEPQKPISIFGKQYNPGDAKYESLKKTFTDIGAEPPYVDTSPSNKPYNPDQIQEMYQQGNISQREKTTLTKNYNDHLMEKYFPKDGEKIRDKPHYEMTDEEFGAKFGPGKTDEFNAADEGLVGPASKYSESVYNPNEKLLKNLDKQYSNAPGPDAQGKVQKMYEQGAIDNSQMLELNALTNKKYHPSLDPTAQSYGNVLTNPSDSTVGKMMPWEAPRPYKEEFPGMLSNQFSHEEAPIFKSYGKTEANLGPDLGIMSKKEAGQMIGEGVTNSKYDFHFGDEPYPVMRPTNTQGSMNLNSPNYKLNDFTEPYKPLPKTGEDWDTYYNNLKKSESQLTHPDDYKPQYGKTATEGYDFGAHGHLTEQEALAKVKNLELDPNEFENKFGHTKGITGDDVWKFKNANKKFSEMKQPPGHTNSESWRIFDKAGERDDLRKFSKITDKDYTPGPAEKLAQAKADEGFKPTTWEEYNKKADAKLKMSDKQHDSLTDTNDYDKLDWGESHPDAPPLDMRKESWEDGPNINTTPSKLAYPEAPSLNKRGETWDTANALEQGKDNWEAGKANYTEPSVNANLPKPKWDAGQMEWDNYYANNPHLDPHNFTETGPHGQNVNKFANDEPVTLPTKQSTIDKTNANMDKFMKSKNKIVNSPNAIGGNIKKFNKDIDENFGYKIGDAVKFTDPNSKAGPFNLTLKNKDDLEELNHYIANKGYKHEPADISLFGKPAKSPEGWSSISNDNQGVGLGYGDDVKSNYYTGDTVEFTNPNKPGESFKLKIEDAEDIKDLNKYMKGGLTHKLVPKPKPIDKTVISQSKSPVSLNTPKKVKQLGGTHGAELVEHEGKQKVFKPSEEDVVPLAEEYGSKIANMINPNVPVAERINFKDYGKGSVQDYKPGMVPFKQSEKLSQSDKDTLLTSHISDWITGNHDAHEGQFMRHPKTKELIPYDKGQSWKHWQDEKLSPDYHPNVDFGARPPIYKTLVGQIHPSIAKAEAERIRDLHSDAIMKHASDFAKVKHGPYTPSYESFMDYMEKKLDNLPNAIEKYYTKKP